MAIQQINIGAAPNDKTGDKARDWAQKTNANFTNPDHAASKIMATPAQALAGTPDVIPDAEQVRKNHVAQAATIAALRALEPAFDGQQVELLGHTTAGIGGGVFYHDAASVAADDNGVTIVTAGGKRWMRSGVDGEVDVTWFGLVGDFNGVTGTNNSLLFESILHRAQEGEFNTILIPDTGLPYFFSAQPGKSTCVFARVDVVDFQANPRNILITGNATIAIDNSVKNTVWISGPDDSSGTTPVNICTGIVIDGNDTLTITSAFVDRVTYDSPYSTLPFYGIGINASRMWRCKFKRINFEFVKGIVQAPSADGLYDSTNSFVQQLDIYGNTSTHAQVNFIELTQGWSIDIEKNTVERGNGGIDMQRSSGQSFYRTSVRSNTLQANGLTTPFKCNFGVAFSFVSNYFESNRTSSGAALPSVDMSPVGTALNSLVFEGNTFAQNAAALNLVGASFAHVELDGFTNFYPKGNNFTGGNGYKLTNSTGRVYSESETYIPAGSTYTEGLVAIGSIPGYVVVGPSFLDANGSAIVAAKQIPDSGIGLEFSESFRITSGTSHEFKTVGRGVVIVSCQFTPQAHIIISLTDAGTAPLSMAAPAGSIIDLTAAPATPAVGRINIAPNATSTGLVITSNLTTDRNFYVKSFTAGSIV